MYNAKAQPKGSSKVLVFGAGNFGSCLASHLGDSQHDVYIWAREEKMIAHFNKYHRNSAYLKDHVFPESIIAVGPALPSKEFMEDMDVLLFAIPTQFLRYAWLDFVCSSSFET
jgi:glycerol-3-phosphate dehydrogenase